MAEARGLGIVGNVQRLYESLLLRDALGYAFPGPFS